MRRSDSIVTTFVYVGPPLGLLFLVIAAYGPRMLLFGLKEAPPLNLFFPFLMAGIFFAYLGGLLPAYLTGTWLQRRKEQSGTFTILETSKYASLAHLAAAAAYVPVILVTNPAEVPKILAVVVMLPLSAASAVTLRSVLLGKLFRVSTLAWLIGILMIIPLLAKLAEPVVDSKALRRVMCDGPGIFRSCSREPLRRGPLRPSYATPSPPLES